MNKRVASAASSLLLLLMLLALVDYAYAEESLTDKFLGSPLLVLAILLVFVLIALIYHKIRK